MATKTFIMDMG